MQDAKQRRLSKVVAPPFWFMFVWNAVILFFPNFTKLVGQVTMVHCRTLYSTELQEKYWKSSLSFFPSTEVIAGWECFSAQGEQRDNHRETTDIPHWSPQISCQFITGELWHAKTFTSSGFSDLGDVGHTAAFQACRETTFGWGIRRIAHRLWTANVGVVLMELESTSKS